MPVALLGLDVHVIAEVFEVFASLKGCGEKTSAN